MVAMKDAAAHVFLSVKTFRELIARGASKKAAPGEWALDVVRKDFFAFSRAAAAGRARATGSLDLSAERAKLARAQTEAAQFKQALVRGEYVRVADVAAVVARDYGVIRECFLTLPGKEADALSFGDAERRVFVEDRLHEAVSEVLANLSDLDKFAALAAAAEKCVPVQPKRKQDDADE